MLSVCLVIRNEQDKIIDCLSRITILADEIIIIDTGSTDKTVEIIKKWIAKIKAERDVHVHEVGNKFHDIEGDFNFGAAKTYAFEQATHDYVMWLDANDKVSDGKELKKAIRDYIKKSPDIRIILPTYLTNDFYFNRVRIGPRSMVKMEGVIHEHMTFSKKCRTVVIPIAINNNKTGRDLKRNLRILLKEWDKNKDTRTAFYLATTYRDLKDYENAIKWYKLRISEFPDDKYWEEQFKAMECICELRVLEEKVKGVDVSEIKDLSEKMIKIYPNRREGYFYNAHYLMFNKQYREAGSMIRKSERFDKPTFYNLWVNDKLYKKDTIEGFIGRCNIEYFNSGVNTDVIIEDYSPTSMNNPMGIGGRFQGSTSGTLVLGPPQG